MIKSIGLFLGILAISIAQAQQSKTAAINEILMLTRTKEKTEKVISVFFETYKKNRKDISETTWNKIESDFNYTFFIQGLTSLYENNYSISELNEIKQYIRNNNQEGYNKMTQRIQKPIFELGSKLMENLKNYTEKNLEFYGF